MLTDDLLDDEGYPTDEALDCIERWPYIESEQMLEFVRGLWSYPHFWIREGDTLSISTGGWSGNESLVKAMKNNHAFWHMCWESSRRGGHYTFDMGDLRRCMEMLRAAKTA